MLIDCNRKYIRVIGASVGVLIGFAVGDGVGTDGDLIGMSLGRTVGLFAVALDILLWCFYIFV